MKRRIAVTAGLAGLLAALLAGCGPADQGPVVFPTDRVELVAAYDLQGGFVPPAALVFDAPIVLVYSDGRAIADAERTLTLDRDQLTDLVGTLRGHLDGLDRTVVSRESKQVVDAPDTVLAVRRGDGSLQTVSAYALDAVDDYPGRLVRAQDLLKDLADRVRRDGTPYVGERVRLVVDERDDGAPTGGEVRPWPAAIPIPPPGSFGLRTADLAGDAARAVATTFPADAGRNGPWPVFATEDGKRFGVAWRYLVPDETIAPN